MVRITVVKAANASAPRCVLEHFETLRAITAGRRFWSTSKPYGRSPLAEVPWIVATHRAAHSRAARRDDGAVASPLKAALRAQRSAFSVPDLNALGRAPPPATLRRAENPARRAKKRFQRSQSLCIPSPAESSGVFACRAATVASGVNPPEQRPSVSAASSHRRSARPSSTRMARSRSPLGGRDNRRVQERLGSPVLRRPLKALVFKRRGSATMDTGDREYLVAYYREDIGKLAALLGRDLSCWLR